MSYTAHTPKVATGSPKCPTCGKSVYFNEQVLALDKAWHRRCLKCAKCSKVLDPGNLSDRDGQVYCSHCYAAVAGLKGYGHGALNESHISGGAAGEAAGGVVLQGADSDTPVSTGSMGSGLSAASSPKFCPNCGSSLPGGAKFCANCGHALQ